MPVASFPSPATELTVRVSGNHVRNLGGLPARIERSRYGAGVSTPNEPGDAAAHDAAIGGQSGYLDRLMRRESFAALWPLFANGEKPAKELTESFSALEHLRPLIRSGEPLRVLHIGDGAHARTAALFSIKTTAQNISIDPQVNEALVEGWRDLYAIERFEWRKARIEDTVNELAALPPMRTFVTFVHAHVGVDRILSLLHWDAAFTLACCLPASQLSTEHRVHHGGSDSNVLSPGRTFQVLLPPS